MDADREAAIRELLDFIEVFEWNGEKAIKIKNAHFYTDGIDAPTVVTIDGRGARGWQWPFMVVGQDTSGTKCLGCDELAENQHVICARCKVGLRAIRNLDEEMVQTLVEVLTDERTKAFFGLLTIEGVKKYMEDEIGQLAGDSRDEGDGEDRGSA
jgi:hypothetical protein